MTKKELILKFYEEVFNQWDVSHIDDYMKDDYKQHNAMVPDGKAGFLEFCGKFLSMEPHMEIYHILEDKDLVCVFFKCTLANGMVNKVFDLYRIEDGKLAEHWDSVEHDVGKIAAVHGNGLF